MIPDTLTYVFLTALALATLLQLWLAGRQIHSIARNRGQIPGAFADKLSLEEHQKAADYTTAKVRFGRIDLVFGALLTLLWTLGGGLRNLNDLWAGLNLSAFLTGLAFLMSAFLVMSIIDLPFGVYRTFVLEQRFGFNRTTTRTFVIDLLKQLVLFTLIGVPIAAFALWLMEKMGPNWWMYLWLTWLTFSLIMMWVYPTFIAPLFNKFNPLDNQELRKRIEALLSRNGFASNGIYVMDGSRRSGHGNAYFTGIGSSKRIVFFDTLLESLSADEIEAVLAHEVGHFKRKHIAKQIVISAALALVSLAVLGYLIDKPWFYTSLGLGSGTTAKALLLFFMVLPSFTFFLQPLASWFSRRHEFEADHFAATQANADDLVRALVKLYRENANTLTPDPLFSAFHDSHPPAAERIAHLQRLSVEPL